MTKTLKDITKEWDERFQKECVGTVNGVKVAFLPLTEDYIHSRDFALLEAQRAELVEKIEALRKKRWSTGHAEYFNALNEITESIQQP